MENDNENGGPNTPNSKLDDFSDIPMDLDFIDEIFFDGCWVETTDSPNALQMGQETPSIFHQEDGSNLSEYVTLANAGVGDFVGSHSTEFVESAIISGKTQVFQVEGSDSGKRLWIEPKASGNDLDASLAMKERLMMAVKYLRECTNGKDVLVQIWVPIKRGGRQVLVTSDQPYMLGSNSRRLEIYRNVSRTYQFPADEGSVESVGLPGRVFLQKLPEWTPDVRFFRSEEYPRIDYARRYDVRGSLAVPVFEQGSGTCLGVVEIITTAQKINYGPDIENVCRALEAVHLRSSQSLLPPSLKAHSELYQAALPRMLEVLKSACKIYRLPLALTWASCVYQGKEGCRHSNENYALCVSTVDSACFVADQQRKAFQEACSEHHLIKGQGIVGRAFATNKPCYSGNITAFGKTEYPLSHHARMFGLHCAIAIPAVSIYTGSADFVLEFFLPDDCKDDELRKHTLESLASAIHVAFQNSGFTTEKEFGEAVILPKEVGLESEKRLQQGTSDKQTSSPSKDPNVQGLTWVPHMVKTKGKGSRVPLTLDYQKEPEEKFNLTTEWESPRSESHHKELNQDFWQLEQNSQPGEGDSGSISFGADLSHTSKRSGGKKRTKTEKTISLQVLQQHFAGSLKDAAKSIGVCPTTLKRICRQHGITRWPSRKIKKVGHSLKKLQHVIDSVHGAEGSIKLSSFYSSFPELHPSKHSERGTTSPNPAETSKQLSPQAANDVVSPRVGALQNLSSCSQSSTSATSSSTCAKQNSMTANACHSGDAVLSEDTCGLKRARSDAELHVSTQDETKLLVRSQSHKSLGKLPGVEPGPSIPNDDPSNMHHSGILKVKATYGEEKIRLSLQQNWSFTDLQYEIGRRFHIDGFNTIDLKYLDDDQEWVLLTCDADLEECIDICRTSQGDTIRINLVHATHPSSFGSDVPAQHQNRFL